MENQRRAAEQFEEQRREAERFKEQRLEAERLEEQRREAEQLEEQRREAERSEEEDSAGGQDPPTEATALEVAWARVISEASSLFRDLTNPEKRDFFTDRTMAKFNTDPLTSLGNAAKNGRIGEVKILLGHYNADINGFCDYSGSLYTPLMLAVVEGKHDVIKLLLELGADVNVQSMPGKETALMMATHAGDSIESLLLLEHGGNNLDLMDNKGQTGLDHLYRKLNSVKRIADSFRTKANPRDASLAKKVDDEYNELDAAVTKALEARASISETLI